LFTIFTESSVLLSRRKKTSTMSTTTSLADAKHPEESSHRMSKELGEKVDERSSDEVKDIDTDSTTGPAADYPQGFQFFSVIAALMLNVFLVALDQTIVATAIPKITDEVRTASVEHGIAITNTRAVQRLGSGRMVCFSILHDLRWLPKHMGEDL
jgi:hypothetical protein